MKQLNHIAIHHVFIKANVLVKYHQRFYINNFIMLNLKNKILILLQLIHTYVRLKDL